MVPGSFEYINQRSCLHPVAASSLCSSGSASLAGSTTCAGADASAAAIITLGHVLCCDEVPPLLHLLVIISLQRFSCTCSRCTRPLGWFLFHIFMADHEIRRSVGLAVRRTKKCKENIQFWMELLWMSSLTQLRNAVMMFWNNEWRFGWRSDWYWIKEQHYFCLTEDPLRNLTFKNHCNSIFTETSSQDTNTRIIN